MSTAGRGAAQNSDESGTALVEFVWLAILLLVPIVYMLVAVFDVQRASYGVSAASKAAARAFLLAPDVDSGRDRAERAVSAALGDQRVDDGRLSIRCLPLNSACLTPGSSVRVVVAVSQQLPLMPDFLGERAGTVHVDSTHVEPYSKYRTARP